MTPFLKRIAEYFLSEFDNSEDNICIVTPNRRAALYIRSYISGMIKKTSWAPDILSLEDFINRLSGLKIVDNLTLMMEFHNVLNNNNGKSLIEDNSFEELINWAPMLLQDFDEIDSNVEEPDKLFEYLSDIKRLDVWDPSNKEPSDYQKRYLDFFKNIPEYHKKFKENLLSKKIAYQGLSHHIAASEIDKTIADLPWGKVIFAGLNALNQTEEKIISALLENDKAKIVWDCDEYYIDNNHEAGFFIRKYLKKWQNHTIIKKENSFKETSKNVNILGIAKSVNQVQLAGNVLSDKINPEEYEKTALILADESLMLPMLSALPSKVSKLNITMGYQLSATAFYSFAEAVLNMHIRSTGQSSSEEGKAWFYYKDILKILKHPYSNYLFDDSDKYLSNIISDAINKSNRSFYSIENIMAVCNNNQSDIIKTLFSNWNNSTEKAISFFKQVLQLLEKSYFDKDDDTSNSDFSIEIASLSRFNLLLNRFDMYIATYKQPENLQVFKLVFKNLVSSLRIPFSGEPLEGLQIMGLLETRNLDFKNIIVFPVNESILPKGKSQNSFIPFDVKKKFKLNTYKERDAIYAYHFYRLLQRAKNIYLIYNTEADKIGGKEKSRFISQIEHELKDFENIKINEKIIPVSSNLHSSDEENIVVEKTPDIIEKIHKLGERGFSPSSINMYLKCSLRFYFEKIMKLKESDEVEETVELNTLGSIIHDVLKELLNPFIGKVIKAEDLNIEDKNIQAVLKSKFEKYYEAGEIDKGKNYLLFRVAMRMIGNYLKMEKAHIAETYNIEPVTIISLENEYKSSMSIKNNGEDIKFNIIGTADRIDKTGDIYRVIDYKTGKVGSNELTFDSFDELLQEDGNKEKSFQLLCYSWLYANNSNAEKILPSIISFRKISEGLFKIKNPEIDKGVIDKSYINEFENSVLKLIFEEIFDKNTPFQLTKNIDNCDYCPYKTICDRI